VAAAAARAAPADHVDAEPAAQPKPPAPAQKRGTAIRASVDSAPPAPPSLVAAAEPQAEALARVAPAPTPRPPPPAPAVPEHGVVDSSFSLLLSDWEKVAHPWDRFQPSVYNMEHTYAQGVLTVRVGPEETLSHFSDWSGLRGSAIRNANGMRRSSDFRMDRKIRLKLDSAAAAEFLKRREEYFRGLEEDFYARYHVEGLEPLAAVRGTNVWNLAQEREIPFWLFLKHNSGRALDVLRPGDTLLVPVVAEGWRRWGFTRYAGTRDYLEGVHRFLHRPERP
jgi:hypothetical protein